MPMSEDISENHDERKTLLALRQKLGSALFWSLMSLGNFALCAVDVASHGHTVGGFIQLLVAMLFAILASRSIEK